MYTVLAIVSHGYSVQLGRFPRVTHPCATFHHPEGWLHVRLACVRHAASVRSEPGSNSQVDFANRRSASIRKMPLVDAGSRIDPARTKLGNTKHALGRPKSPGTAGIALRERTAYAAAHASLPDSRLKEQTTPLGHSLAEVARRRQGCLICPPSPCCQPC